MATKPAAKPTATSKPVAAKTPAANKPAPGKTVKTTIAKPATVSTAKPAAKPATKVATKPVAAVPPKKVASKPAATIAKSVAAEKPKTQKVKMERDSFTMPKEEYAQIAALKKRLESTGKAVKKSELLRAGLKLLSGLDDTKLKAALATVPTIKTGRPKK